MLENPKKYPESERMMTIEEVHTELLALNEERQRFSNLPKWKDEQEAIELASYVHGLSDRVKAIEAAYPMFRVAYSETMKSHVLCPK